MIHAEPGEGERNTHDNNRLRGGPGPTSCGCTHTAQYLPTTSALQLQRGRAGGTVGSSRAEAGGRVEVVREGGVGRSEGWRRGARYHFPCILLLHYCLRGPVSDFRVQQTKIPIVTQRDLNHSLIEQARQGPSGGRTHCQLCDVKEADRREERGQTEGLCVQ